MSFCAARAGSSGQISAAVLLLDRGLLRFGVALLGRGHQRRIDDLPAHGEVARSLSCRSKSTILLSSSSGSPWADSRFR
ncbi:hypothetical protein GGQ88_004188 [Novosphingobium hassiacum]|uniref:Uncharacterized protein n=1 Tax=Novosphingobium hassiacum TaxID=173676 RepID=A0A7W5ZZF4_9SPHN|nr:hypothetical protein [Novosphingobium hassiacum]MBB3862885.1 hypothetical protein [Novosphingobium hassiacum]